MITAAAEQACQMQPWSWPETVALLGALALLAFICYGFFRILVNIR